MKSFQEMPLASELQKALTDLNFTTPTEIQGTVIPVAMEGKDLMACAETGSGKTAAYGIPMVSRLLENPKATALVLAPTRELAHQIADFLRELSLHCKHFYVTSIVGGAEMRKQIRNLRKRPRIIVATPGRLADHLRRNTVDLKSTEILILDEGDRMLDMGFAPQLDEILDYVPKKRQTALFTATLPKKVQELAETYLNQPEKINADRVSLPVAAIKQSVVQVTYKEKDNRILDELNQRKGSVIVFVKTKHRTDSLARNLEKYGYDVDLIHGGRTQGQRNKAIRNFKEGKSRILCATDIAARGIDIPQVEHVINFDLPMMSEDYVHRIGRTARNGASGEAVSFVAPDENRDWNSLARKYKIEGVMLEEGPRGESKKRRGGRGRTASRGGRFGGGRSSRDDRSQGQATKFRSRKSSSGKSFGIDKPTEKTGPSFKKKRFFKSGAFKKSAPKRMAG